MATIVDTLVTKYTLDSSQYSAAAGNVTAATEKTGKSLSQAHGHLKQFDDGFRSFSEVASKGLQVLRTAAGIFAGIAAASVVAGVAMAKSAADYDAMRMALEAIEGSAAKAAKRMDELRQIAKMPGLGVMEAIEGYTRLRRAGLDPSMAKEILKQFGNAIALGGGGKDELGRIMLAIQQMANKPFLQGEELMQLTEAGIPAYKIIKDLFGTADTEELKKNGIESKQVIAALVEELGRLPRVAGGAKNAFENAQDAMSYAAVVAGTAINKELVPKLNEAADALTNLSDTGALQSAFSIMMDNIVAMVGSGSESMEVKLLDALEVGVAVSAAMRNATENLKGLYEWLREHSALGGLLGGLSEGDYSPLAEARQARKIIEQQMEVDKRRREKGLPIWGEKSDAGAPDTSSAGQDAPEIQGEQVRMLKAIEKNTAPIREMMSFIFGGGELGRAGVGVMSMRGSRLHTSVHRQVMAMTNMGLMRR